MTYQDSSRPPFRADHVGSLLRPARLHRAREQHMSGDISDNDLREIEDECIAHAITRQEEVGLLSVTDGEFRRESWHYDFLCGLEGIDATGSAQGPKFKGGQGVKSLQVSGKISNP